MSISEQLDATSYLVAPSDSGDDFVATLEQDAGLILGGIDWAIHKFFGVSVIAEIVKPITGDWISLERSESAWSHASAAANAVAANFGALPGQTVDGWTGEAADAFRSRMTSIAASFREYGDGAQTISEVVKGLVEVSQAAAEVIAGVISFIGDLITQILIELAIPLVGPLAAGGTIAAKAGPFFAKMRKAYEAIEKVVRVVERVIDTLYKLLQRLNRLKDMAELAMRGGEVANGLAVGAASSQSFGTAS